MADRQLARSAYRGYERRNMRSEYIYGNTVVQPDRIPSRAPQPKKKKKVDLQTRRNRKKALSMNLGYSAFLVTSIALVAVFLVLLIQGQYNIRRLENEFNVKEAQYVSLKEQNNVTESQIVNKESLNMQEVLKRAVDEFGMVYASPDQIRTYQTVQGNSVRQFADVPESGRVEME